MRIQISLPAYSLILYKHIYFIIW